MNAGQLVRFRGLAGTIVSAGPELSKEYQKLTVCIGPSALDLIDIYAWELEK